MISSTPDKALAPFGYLEIGPDPTTRLHLAGRRRAGRLELVASGGQSAILLHEEARISTRPGELDPAEAAVLAPYLADHPGAAIVRFVRDAFGDWELRTSKAEHPFRFYSGLLLAALEAPRSASGLRTVQVVGIPAPTTGPIAVIPTLFHLVERA